MTWLHRIFNNMECRMHFFVTAELLVRLTITVCHFLNFWTKIINNILARRYLSSLLLKQLSVLADTTKLCTEFHILTTLLVKQVGKFMDATSKPQCQQKFHGGRSFSWKKKHLGHPLSLCLHVTASSSMCVPVSQWPTTIHCQQMTYQKLHYSFRNAFIV